DVPVRVTRETVAYFRHDGAPLASVVELDEATRHHAMYALHDPVHGVKAGAHHAGRRANPDEEEPADPGPVQTITAWVRERLPDVDPDPIGADSCIYTSTEDESFVIERRGRLVIGSACSGHGFKFAPAVGRRLADLGLRSAPQPAALPAAPRGPPEPPHPVPGEGDAPHRGGDGAGGVHRERVDPLPPRVAVPGHEAGGVRGDRAGRMGSRPARAPPFQDVRHPA